MGLTLVLLLALFVLGLLFAGLLLAARSPRARLALLVAGLGLVDMGSLAVLTAAFLVSRLDGSRPPGLMEFLAALWIPVLLLALVNGLLVFIYFRRKQ